MTVPFKHILSQTDVLQTLVRAGLNGVISKSAEKGTLSEDDLSDSEVTQVVPARPDDLIDDYIRHVGGNLSRYKDTVPFHLFPQWGFPIMMKSMSVLPFDMLRILNAGCEMKINGAIPRKAELHLRSKLLEVDQNDSRIIIRQYLSTGIENKPDLLEVQQTAIIPVGGRSSGKSKKKKEKPLIPYEVEEIGGFRAGSDAGVDFALLTGDVNPLHWLGPVARMSGFKRPILHGFSILARTAEILLDRKEVEPGSLTGFSIRFLRPLYLPGSCRVFIDENGGIYTGHAPGGLALNTGEYAFRKQKEKN